VSRVSRNEEQRIYEVSVRLVENKPREIIVVNRHSQVEKPDRVQGEERMGVRIQVQEKREQRKTKIKKKTEAGERNFQVEIG